MKQGLPFHILVVEDDPDDRLIIDEAFKEIGYEGEVKKLPDGDYLLQYLETIEPSLYPSLIVLDNFLPKADALTILTQLKAHPAYKKIPVIVYTTAVSPMRKERLLAAGAYACIKKGADMSEMIAIAQGLKALAEESSSEVK